MSIPPSVPHSEDDMTDRMFAQLKPVELDSLTDEAHQRRRAADLARAIQSSPARSRDRSHAGSRARGRSPHPPWRHWMSRRKPIFFIAGTVAAGVAAAAIIIPGVLSGNTPSGRPPTLSQPSGTADTGHLAARKFLLAAAETAAREPDDSGQRRYWYYRMRTATSGPIPTKEQNENYNALSREFAAKARKLKDKPDEIRALAEEYRQKAYGVTRGEESYSAEIASSDEAWTPRDTDGSSRSVSGLDPKFSFASPVDEEKWKKLGSPDLGLPAKPQTTNGKLSAAGLCSDWEAKQMCQNMPTDKDGMEKWLLRDYQGYKGYNDIWTSMSYTEYLSSRIGNALIAPLSPETRAAFLQVLADQPGITSLGKATDSLGRTGVALAMTYEASVLDIDWGQKMEYRAIFDEQTGNLLTYDYRPQGESGITEQVVIENSGWVDKIGELPQN